MGKRSAWDYPKRAKERPFPHRTAGSPLRSASLFGITAAWALVAWISGGSLSTLTAVAEEFPRELVDFVPYEKNPVFTGRGEGHWDEKLNERGWILREDDLYRMWYTGTKPGSSKKLGYATSPDGLTWTRYQDNPLYDEHWVEDMIVVKHDDTYYMFVEGDSPGPVKGVQIDLLTSADGIRWKRHGKIDIRLTTGQPIPDVWAGTPTVWISEGVGYLLYELNNDEAIWLATSPDLKVWTNVQDEPVMRPGPGFYDKKWIAVNQFITHKGRYYIYYHGLGESGGKWTTNVAMSTDLLNWKKYPHNPILPTEADKSSGILVHDGEQYRLYTMHDQVHVHYPRVP
jgi:hypothetical protein